MYIEVQTAEGGTVRILTNTCMEGDTLILRQLHIEEGIAGSIGPRELRATLEAFANEIGNAFGARSVRIEGGIRNSGTINPRTPRVREYEVR